MIKNITKKTTLSEKYKIASTFIDNVFGLLLESNPRTMIFDTRFGLHTFGMTKPIDIILLDSKGRVVKVGLSIRPNRLFIYWPIYKRVIELPEGSVNNSKTCLNDKIVFE